MIGVNFESIFILIRIIFELLRILVYLKFKNKILVQILVQKNDLFYGKCGGCIVGYEFRGKEKVEEEIFEES